MLLRCKQILRSKLKRPQFIKRDRQCLNLTRAILRGLGARRVCVAFGISFVTSLTVIFIAALISTDAHPIQRLIDELAAIPAFRSSGTSDQEEFLSRLSREERRAFTSSVGYLAEVITRATKNTSTNKKLAQSIVAQSLAANYDPLLVAAVIKSESTFNQAATSNRGAQGLMQVMPSTAEYIRQIHGESKDKSSGAASNIDDGIRYLKYLEKKFKGNRELALIAYNWGPANVNQALSGGKKFPQASVRYARNILSDQRRWQQEYLKRAPEFQHIELETATG